ncbi:MAG: SOS response-associated peptidase [Chloroflexi bacterium]|nr:SOS response-associated peptidase [Chloroflexota bacterium]
MCGRFTLTEVDPDLVAQTFSLESAPELPPRFNIAPTQNVAVIVRDVDSGRNQFMLMRWGLIPHWSKDPSIGSRMINARGETVHEKPSFRTPLKRQRCLVVADGFYEWQKQDSGPKVPMYITLKGHALFAFAGLWDRWIEPESGDPLFTCTIITTAPNELVAPIHNRMPVILARESYDHWLNPSYTDPVQLLPLLTAYPADEMDYYPVSRKVNKPINDGPDLIERAADPGDPPSGPATSAPCRAQHKPEILWRGRIFPMLSDQDIDTIRALYERTAARVATNDAIQQAIADIDWFSRSVELLNAVVQRKCQRLSRLVGGG